MITSVKSVIGKIENTLVSIDKLALETIVLLECTGNFALYNDSGVIGKVSDAADIVGAGRDCEKKYYSKPEKYIYTAAGDGLTEWSLKDSSDTYYNSFEEVSEGTPVITVPKEGTLITWAEIWNGTTELVEVV